MKQVTRWILLSMCGWLAVVKSIQQNHTACQTLHVIYSERLNIKCNSDEIVYINHMTFNYLGRNYSEIANNNDECLNTSTSVCFWSIPFEIPWSYILYREISKICNGNYNCTLTYIVFKSFVTKLLDNSICKKDNEFKTRIGCFFECFPSKSGVLVGKKITETRDGSLYLTSNESEQCLVKGSIESARILEQVNMRFTVSDRKSRLCTDILTNGSFNYNEDLSCLRSVGVFLLDIQTTNTLSGKLWIEFKGVSLQLDCRDNIQFPPVVHVVKDLKQNGSLFLPMIIGLVAGALLLSALILILIIHKRRVTVSKRKHALAIKAEARRRAINVTSMFEGYQECTYNSKDTNQLRNGINDVKGTASSFDDSYYSTVDTDGNYDEIYFKKNTSESGRYNWEQNLKSRDSNYVTLKSSKRADNKFNTSICEVNLKKGTNNIKKSLMESRDPYNETPRSSKRADNKFKTIIGGVNLKKRTDDTEKSQVMSRDSFYVNPRSSKKADNKFYKNIGEVNLRKRTDDTEKSQVKSRDSYYVTPRSSKIADNKFNTTIGEITSDVYATVCKTNYLISK